MPEFDIKNSKLKTLCPKELKINMRDAGLTEEDIFSIDGMDKIQATIEKITELKVEDFDFKFDSKHPKVLLISNIKYDGKANGWY